MEEILASIRQIISEDSEGTSGKHAEDASSHAQSADDTPEAASEDDGVETESLTYVPEPPEDEADSEPEPHSTMAAVRHEPAPQLEAQVEHAAKAVSEPPRGAPRPAPVSRTDSEGASGMLLSREQGDAVSGSFGALAHTILAQNTRTLEDVVEEMLQPMLKSWLDDNLPTLVERLVKDEIERVSRGRR